MKRIAFIALVSLLIAMPAIGQSDSLRRLKVGDKVPDILLGKMLNYKSGAIRIGDFRGKLLLLDFWSVYCSSCVAAFPSMKSLQDKFGDQIMILPVCFTGWKGEHEAEDFLEKRKKQGREIPMPTAVQFYTYGGKDTALIKLFPIEGFPHEVWIDKNGIVIGLTDQHAVTAENIMSVLLGKPVRFENKNFQLSYRADIPLLVNQNGGPDSAFLYRSLFARYTDSIPIGARYYADSSGTRIFFSNTNIFLLFGEAFNGLYGTAGLDKKIYLSSGNEYMQKGMKLFKQWLSKNITNYDSLIDFRRKYFFCYDLSLPPGFTLKEAYSCMIQDLDRFCKVRSGLEKRKIPCLSLIRTGNTDRLKARSEKQEINISEDNLQAKINSSAIGELAVYLNSLFDDHLIIDETGYKGNISIDLKISSRNNLSLVRKALLPFGLDLEETVREIDVLDLK